MKFGVITPYAEGLVTSGGFMRDLVGTLEQCGVESVWTVEHVVVAKDYHPAYPYSDSGRMQGEPGTVPMPDPLELLAFYAACSSSLMLGTAMVVAPLHSPTVLAKRVATIDRLSGGRVILGLGIGWQREEYAAVGAPFDRRGARLDDCIGALRALWEQHPATYHGTFTSFDDVFCEPRPAAGRVPIVVGGHSAAVVRRAARIADGWFPFTVGPDEFATLADQIRADAGACGRDPGRVEITAWPGSADPSQQFSYDWARRYADAGAQRLVLSCPIRRPDELDALAERLTRYRDEVAGRL